LYKKIIAGILLLGVTVAAGFAPATAGKDKGLEAKIVYEIVYEELPEMFEPYAAMLPKEMVSYVKGAKVRVEQSVMGVTTVSVSDSEKKTGFMLMDQFGTKTAYTIDSKDMEKESTDASKNYDVTYTEETKEIAGYKCKKAEIKNKADGVVTNAWVTEQIKGTNKQYPFLKGFALEYNVHNDNGMTIAMKVKTFEKMKVPNEYFEIPKEYTKKTMADFQKEMEKMQGGDGDDD